MPLHQTDPSDDGPTAVPSREAVDISAAVDDQGFVGVAVGSDENVVGLRVRLIA